MILHIQHSKLSESAWCSSRTNPATHVAATPQLCPWAITLPCLSCLPAFWRRPTAGWSACFRMGLCWNTQCAVRTVPCQPLMTLALCGGSSGAESLTKVQRTLTFWVDQTAHTHSPAILVRLVLCCVICCVNSTCKVAAVILQVRCIRHVTEAKLTAVLSCYFQTGYEYTSTFHF